MTERVDDAAPDNSPTFGRKQSSFLWVLSKFFLSSFSVLSGADQTQIETDLPCGLDRRCLCITAP